MGVLIDTQLTVRASRKLEAISPTDRAAVAHFVFAAKRAAEGLHYLADLDAIRFATGASHADGCDNDIVDDSHVRWSAVSAVTAIDLCAAALGRAYKLRRKKELSLRELDPRSTDNAARVTAVDAHWLPWLRATTDDARYDRILSIRHPLTHGDAIRVISTGSRYGYKFGILDESDPTLRAAAPVVFGRTIIEECRDYSTLVVTSFLQVADSSPA